MKKRFVVGVCAGAALVAGVAAGVVRRGREVCESCCEYCDTHEECGCECSEESKECEGCGCCGGGCAVSTALGDLIPGLPGKLERMRDEGHVFVATSSGVTPEQHEAYLLECRKWGFYMPLRRVLRGTSSGGSVRDFRSFSDVHGRTVSIMYNKEAQTLVVLLDASGFDE